MTTVLVTGVSRHLGAKLAVELAALAQVARVIGVDAVAPPGALAGVEFVRADIRNAALARIMASAEVDVVVHLSVSTSAPGGARVSQKEINVIGTMQLLAACQSTPSVRRLVVKSTGSVYGSSPRDPAMFTEDMPLRRPPRSGYLRDAIEVEGYVRGVARRRPDLEVSVLRMAHVVGPNVETAITDYFRRPVVLAPFGYDARLQLLHESDAVAALRTAAVGPHVGTVNVAGDGVLTMVQAAGLLGRPLVPIPTATGRLFGRLGERAWLAEVSGEQVDYLMWGRCLDTSLMRSALKLEPSYTTREAFVDFAQHVHDWVPGGRTVIGWVDTALRTVEERLEADLASRLR